MIAVGNDALNGMRRLTAFRPERIVTIIMPHAEDIAVWHGEDRYAGFHSYDEIRHFVERNGWSWDNVRMEEVDKMGRPMR